MRDRPAIEITDGAPAIVAQVRGRFRSVLPWLAGCYSVLSFVLHREILRLCIWMRLLNT